MNLTEPHWDDCIPNEVQLKIGEFVIEHQFSLPADLLCEWHSPIFLDHNWFVRADQYIQFKAEHRAWLRL